jgi:prepilin-type N-terminal cleavage/methylation domain-containing protein
MTRIGGFRIGCPSNRRSDLELRNWAHAGRKAAGLTLIELVVVLAVVSSLLAVMLDRLAYYQEAAEKAAMQQALASIKTGLQVRMAELILANREASLHELERENPMRWLGEGAPPNYLGDYPAKPALRSWYYDAEQRQLVYVPGSLYHIEFREENVKELRFRVALRFESGATTDRKRAVGVAIEPVGGFKWF